MKVNDEHIVYFDFCDCDCVFSSFVDLQHDEYYFQVPLVKFQ